MRQSSFFVVVLMPSVAGLTSTVVPPVPELPLLKGMEIERKILVLFPPLCNTQKDQKEGHDKRINDFEEAVVNIMLRYS